jgi:hypothetical protein
MKAQSIIVKDMHFDNIKLNSLIIQKKYVDKEGNANVPINKFTRRCLLKSKNCKH